VIGGVIGFLVARKLAEHDPEDARPLGIRQAMARHPSTRSFGIAFLSRTH